MGKKLEEIMQRKGFNKYQLSKALDVSPSTVTRWVNGSMVPRYDVLMRLCDILECNTDDVLRGSGKESEAVETGEAVEE